MVIHAIDSRIWLMANEDKELKQALLQSDILVPNGAGITLAAVGSQESRFTMYRVITYICLYFNTLIK